MTWESLRLKLAIAVIGVVVAGLVFAWCKLIYLAYMDFGPAAFLFPVLLFVLVWAVWELVHQEVL